MKNFIEVHDEELGARLVNLSYVMEVIDNTIHFAYKSYPDQDEPDYIKCTESHEVIMDKINEATEVYIERWKV